MNNGNDYSFILDNMRYSYSSVNTYDSICALAFKKQYIDCEERTNNFYAVYGAYIHLILQKYFMKTLDIWDMPCYYSMNYDNNVNIIPPAYPSNLGIQYKNDGQQFFEDFEFNLSDYEILDVEPEINSEYVGIKVIVKPDLVLKDKKTGEVILFDYKSSKLKGGAKQNQTKANKYKKQMFLYCYFYWLERKIEINKIYIWFIRDNKKIEIKVDPTEIAETLNWFLDTIKAIKNEKIWKPNPDKYFCQNLCSVKPTCPYSA